MSEGADRSQILQGGAAICGQGALTAWKQMVMPPISQKSSALLPHTDDFHEAAMHTVGYSGEIFSIGRFKSYFLRVKGILESIEEEESM